VVSGSQIAFQYVAERVIQRGANLSLRLPRRLAVPASESQLTVALALCMVVMALLLCGVIWQSGIIDYQRELIRLLWNARAGG
jgi:hypothetical protein